MKRQLATTAALIAAVAVLAASGRGPLAPPPLTTFHGLWLWWVERGQIVGTFAILRLIAFGGAVYLTAAAAATLLVTCTQWRWLSHLVIRMLVPGTRWLLHGGVALSLAAAPLPRLAARAGPQPDPVAVPVLRRIDPARAPDTDSGVPASRERQPAQTETTRVVQPGDSFWSISRDVLVATWSRQPSDREVASLWIATIRLNRARLPEPGNPDFLLPGMAVVIPGPGTVAR